MTEVVETATGATATASLSGSYGEYYAYDLFNRMTYSLVNGIEARYSYRADGLRYSKNNTVHLLDGSNIVGDVVDVVVEAVYVRGIGLIASKNNGIYEYYLFNAHGDVVNHGGKTYDYDAFGNEKNPEPNDQNNFRFCGEYFDKENGTIYLRARYYNPVIGRFTQQDLWEYMNFNDPLSLNLYTYCHNNPVLYHDPSGRISKKAADQLIKDNADHIIKAAAEFNIDPAILAACIYAEQRLNVAFNERQMDDILKFFLGLDVSVGVVQMKLSTAIRIEDAGYMPMTYEVRTYYTHSFFSFRWTTVNVVSRADILYGRLRNSNETNVMYAAAYLKMIIDIWEGVYSDINSDTAVLATLYNIGEHGTKGANSNPGTNEFGDFAAENYDYMRKLLGLN